MINNNKPLHERGKGEHLPQKTALEVLNNLNKAKTAKKYPNVPAFALPNNAYTDKTANGLTKCIIDFIKLTGGQSERISCEGRVIDDRQTFTDVLGNSRAIGKIRRVKTSAQRGTADISIIVKGGIAVKVEVKIGNDRQSEEQKEYERNVIQAGGYYFIAKDFQSFYDWYILTFGKDE